MGHFSEHLHLVVDHLLVASHVFLQDDLDCDFAVRAFGFADNAIGASPKCLSKAVLGSVTPDQLIEEMDLGTREDGHPLLVITAGLAMQLVHHA
jgi:hypothetical protein